MRRGANVKPVLGAITRMKRFSEFCLQLFGLLLVAAVLGACNGAEKGPDLGPAEASGESGEAERPAAVEPRPEIYANFPLTADLTALSEQQRQMLVLLVEASNVMDDLFWRQAFRDEYAGWLASIGVQETRQF